VLGNGNTSVATSWCPSEYLVCGRQGWFSSILERKLKAHSAISSSRRVCCLTSEQCRHYRLTLQQDGAPAHTARTTMDYLKKRAHQLHWTLHMWPPNNTNINPVDYTLLGCSSATSLPPTTIQDGGRSEASNSHRVAKTLTAFHW